MTLAMRLAWALLIVAVGTLAALLLGNQYPGCLGPIGVTHVQCIEMTGIAPTVWWRPTIAVATISAALLIVHPIRRDRWAISGVAGIVGAIVGAGVYFVMREPVVTGPTSTGATSTVVLPVDPYALLAAACAGAAIAALIVGWMPSRALRQPRST